MNPRQQLGTIQIRELALRPLDRVGGDADVIPCLLRHLSLECALPVCQALALLEQLLLELRRLKASMSALTSRSSSVWGSRKRASTAFGILIFASL